MQCSAADEGRVITTGWSGASSRLVWAVPNLDIPTRRVTKATWQPGFRSGNKLGTRLQPQLDQCPRPSANSISSGPPVMGSYRHSRMMQRQFTCSTRNRPHMQQHQQPDSFNSPFPQPTRPYPPLFFGILSTPKQQLKLHLYPTAHNPPNAVSQWSTTN